MMSINEQSAQKDPRHYGLFYETFARIDYENHVSLQHQDLVIMEKGLIMDLTRPYVRVSPDGVVCCKCCKPKITEIKTPWSLRHCKCAAEFHSKVSKLPYINITNDMMYLQHDKLFGYFAQTQTIMAVLDVDDFFPPAK